MDDVGFRKARMELEALYEGVPDDSVNLTFRHLTDVNLQPNSSLEKKRSNPLISFSRDDQSTPLTKLPSLDFNRALQAANQYSRPDAKISLHPSAQVGQGGRPPLPPPHTISGDNQSCHSNLEHVHVGGLRPALEYSAAYEEASRISSMYDHRHHRLTPGRCRPGIPHSNICTNCSTYIYIFRHRCLVCVPTLKNSETNEKTLLKILDELLLSCQLYLIISFSTVFISCLNMKTYLHIAT